MLGYRIFPDDNDHMNLDVQQVAGDILVVPQFTLAADTQKGMRPSFSSGADPEAGQRLYYYFVKQCREQYSAVATGEFAAYIPNIASNAIFGLRVK